MTEARPFEFKRCVSITRPTGKKAKSLKDLREAIATVNPYSIYHHTCQYFLKTHTLEYTNDFAQWVGDNIKETTLSEHLSIVDPYEFADIEILRRTLLNVLDDYMEKFPEPREAIPGREFFFNEAVTHFFPAGIQACNLAEFLMAVKYLKNDSIYYHVYEARMRQGVNDFSKWILDTMGNKNLAEKIKSIDPFMHNIEGIRERIARAVEDELAAEIEFMRIGGAS